MARGAGGDQRGSAAEEGRVQYQPGEPEEALAEPAGAVPEVRQEMTLYRSIGNYQNDRS